MTNNKNRIFLMCLLLLLAVIVWTYESRAPRVIMVLIFWVSLLLALVQLPFLVGFSGFRYYRPAFIVLSAALPFLIAWAFRAVYEKNLLLLWYEDWTGRENVGGMVAVLVALPALSFLFGLLGRKFDR